jgi:hypothetical protein
MFSINEECYYKLKLLLKMMPTNPPNTPSGPNKLSAMKWLGRLSGTCIVLFLGLSNYMVSYNTDKESRLFQTASFFASCAFYIACAGLTAWGLLFIYRQRNNPQVVKSGMSALKKCVLYILLPSIVITIVILAIAVSKGQLDFSGKSFW